MKAFQVFDMPQGSPEWWDARKGIPTGSGFDRIGFGGRNLTEEDEARVSELWERIGADLPFPVKLNHTDRDGFYLEVTKKNLAENQAPNHWRHLKTMASAERYTSPEIDVLARSIPRELSDGAKQYAAELIAESIGWAKDEFKGSPDIQRGHELEDRARKALAYEVGEEITEVGFCLSECGRFGVSPDGFTKSNKPTELKCPDLHTQARYLIEGGGLPEKYKAQVHGHMIVTGAPYAWFFAYVGDPRMNSIPLKVERDDYTAQLESDINEFCDRLADLKSKILLPLR